MNGEYIKAMDKDKFYSLAEDELKSCVKRQDIDLKKLCGYVQSRIGTIKEIGSKVDFVDNLPEYEPSLYVHKKMKTTEESSLEALKKVTPVLENLNEWTNDSLYNAMLSLISEMGIKNGQMFWPVRTALSGEPTSPCGASELAELLGKEDSLARIKKGIELLENALS